MQKAQGKNAFQIVITLIFLVFFVSFIFPTTINSGIKDKGLFYFNYLVLAQFFLYYKNMSIFSTQFHSFYGGGWALV
jgi:uncharacterized membrane protein